MVVGLYAITTELDRTAKNAKEEQYANTIVYAHHVKNVSVDQYAYMVSQRTIVWIAMVVVLVNINAIKVRVKYAEGTQYANIIRKNDIVQNVMVMHCVNQDLNLTTIYAQS